MAKLLFQGHGSFRITSTDNIVIYVDPYAGEGYDVPADIILVTHQHYDHNAIDKVTKKENCTIIQSYDAIKDGVHQIFTVSGVKIKAVEAYNSNHKKEECVGYIIEVDGLKIYAAGDTSTTEDMKKIKDLNLDYAILPIDGVYNMGPEEATKCAEIIDARFSIPIHMKEGELFDEEMVKKFTAKNRIIVRANEEIEL